MFKTTLGNRTLVWVGVSLNQSSEFLFLVCIAQKRNFFFSSSLKHCGHTEKVLCILKCKMFFFWFKACVGVCM